MKKISFLLFIISLYATALSAGALTEYRNSQLELLLSKERIQSAVQATAKQLNQQYADKEVTLIVVMKGALCTAADLIRELDFPVNIECIKASSYGMSGKTSGTLKVADLDKLDLEGKEVLLVDDIFDTGKTLERLTEQIKAKQPKSFRSLVLLRKNVPHVTSLQPDYVLFDIDNLFVVGYGMDYKEQFRGLSGIYVLTPGW